MVVEEFLLSYSYFAIFTMMVMVGVIGIFPPSKLVYLFAGFLAFQGKINLIGIIIFGGLGHALGNLVQYELAKHKGISIIKKFISFYPLFSFEDIKRIQLVFEKKGLWYLFTGKLLDPLKLIISFFAGLASMNRLVFFGIVFITSMIWAVIFSLLGYYFGASFDNFGWIGFVILVLAVIVMSKFYKEMNSKEINDLLKKK